MLRVMRSAFFIAAFLVALVLLLSVALAIERALEAGRAALLLQAAGSSVGAVVYFLAMSGYGLLYSVGYLMAGNRLGSTARRAVAMVVFAMCYVGFFVLFSDDLSLSTLVMFFAGIACVFFSDILAMAFLEKVRGKQGAG
jgi:hypothetical protein